MNFIDLYELMYDGTQNYDEKIGRQDLETQRAWRAYKVLNSRKGFDWWWHDIEDEIKNEIFDELKRAVA